MTFVGVHNAIRGYFKDEVQDVVRDLVCIYDNTERDDPAPDADLWARVSVLPAASEVMELGSTVAHTGGILLVSLFAKLGVGDKIALGAADTISAAFKQAAVTFESHQVDFRTPSVNPLGRDGGWWRVNVSVPWTTEDA